MNLFLASCGGDKGKDNSQPPSSNKYACAPMDKAKCQGGEGLLGSCLWNVDRCEDKLKELAPNIPQTLGKVKMLAVANGFCAIDMNDELTCIPGSNLEKPIHPHSSQKYRHVAMAVSDAFSQRICATKLDGTSVCFKDGQEQPGPTTAKVLETIPAIFKKTVCAFSGTNIYCESDSTAYEALDQFSNDTEVKKLAKNKPGDPAPTLAGLGFYGSTFKKEKVFALFSSKRLLVGVEDPNKAALWTLFKGNDGAPTVFNDVLSFSVAEEAICLVTGGSKGLICSGGFHDSQVIPDDVKTADLSQVATSMDHTCVITKDSGELKCWGLKKLTKNLPAASGVKQVSVSRKLTCFIDKDDKLNCYGAE